MATDRQALASAVVETVAKALGAAPGAVDERWALGASEGWDSFGHLAVVVAVERRFGVKLSLQELRRAESVRALVEILASRGVQAGPAPDR